MKMKISIDEPLRKAKPVKDTENPWKNLYHTQHLPYTK